MSNTPENRVVEMRFENDQFEKNIHTSINSLDALNKSLNFDKASQSFSAIDKAANAVNFDNIQKSLDRLGQNFTLFGQARLRAINGLIDYAVNAGRKITNSLFGQIQRGGWNRATNIDNAKFKLEGLKIAWEDVYSSIDYAVTGTAYGLDAAANAAAQLSATGVKMGKEMDEALRGISGVAAMTGSSYEDISNIFISGFVASPWWKIQVLLLCIV